MDPQGFKSSGGRGRGRARVAVNSLTTPPNASSSTSPARSPSFSEYANNQFESVYPEKIDELKIEIKNINKNDFVRTVQVNRQESLNLLESSSKNAGQTTMTESPSSSSQRQTNLDENNNESFRTLNNFNQQPTANWQKPSITIQKLPMHQQPQPQQQQHQYQLYHYQQQPTRPRNTYRPKAVEHDDDLCQICDRPDKNVFCKTCGHNWKGRKRMSCPTHTKTVMLMDSIVCPNCHSEDLKEI